MTKAEAIRAIDRHGMLLVFPAANAPEPASLWSVAYPRSKMRWEWDEGGDDRVARLWHLREELSRSRRVVYAKWFRGRATFFSRALFTALLALSLRQPGFRRLSPEAQRLLELLRENSPQSTKELKRGTGLIGRDLESTYTRALKELWHRQLVVGFGEICDGAFPSLAIGATEWIFEDLYRAARELSPEEATATVAETFGRIPLAQKQWSRIERLLRRSPSNF